MRIEEFLSNTNKYNEKEIATAKYGYTVLKNEVPKFIIMLIFFILIGNLTEFLFYMAILTPVRIFTGGLHLKSNIACFIASFVSAVLAIYVLPMLTLPFYIYIAMQVFSIGITAWIAPLKNPMRPIRTKLRYINLKKKACFFILLASLVLAVLGYYSYTHYFVIGIWAIFINSLQLLILQIVNIKKGDSHGNFETTVDQAGN